MKAKEFELPEARTQKAFPDVVFVSGSDYEMGYQYADQLVEKMKSLLVILKARAYLYSDEETIVTDMRVQAFFSEKYDPGLLEWYRGMKDGCADHGYNVTLEDLFLLAVFPGELGARPGGSYPEGFDSINCWPASEKKKQAHGYCNAFAATGNATKDGQPLIAISGGTMAELAERVILIAFPEKGPCFTSFSAVGKPACQMGMNSEGFAWVQTANFNDEEGPWGLFPEIPFHYLTQYCTTPEQAQQWLKEIPKAGATGNFVMSDSEGNLSVTETNNDHFFIRKPGDCGEKAAFVVDTNHFATPGKLDLTIPLAIDKDDFLEDSLCRYATITEFINSAVDKGGVDMDVIHAMFHSDDWVDYKTGEWHYNDPSAARGYDLLEYTEQTVLKPATLTAYYMAGASGGIGVPAGGTGELIKIQLADTPLDIADKMQWDSFGIYETSRNLFIETMNRCDEIKKNYPNQLALRHLLDESFREYERGMDRVSHALLYKKQGLPDSEFLKILGKGMSHYAASQSYANMLTHQMSYYRSEE